MLCYYIFVLSAIGYKYKTVVVSILKKAINGVVKFNFVPFLMNATKLDRESVRTPGTQQGCVGKFSVVVLI